MKSYIWTLPVRIFHWLLAIGFASAFITGESHEFWNLHYAFGAFVGSLLFFRILFGLFGPAYSNFRDFPIGIKKQKEFLRTFFTKTKEYAGHNPAASIVMLLIIFGGFFCASSGYLLYSTENNVLNIGLDAHAIKEIHETLAHLFLILVVIHLTGVIADTIFHRKTGSLKSIFTGYKNIEAENAQLKYIHKVYMLLWFIIPFYFFYLAYRF